MMMKKSLFIFAVIFAVTHPVVSQIDTSNSLFFGFEENSNLHYFKKGEMDKSYKEKTYIENEFKNGKIDFFIEDLLFRHNKIKMRSDTISIKDCPGIKLLDPQQIKDHINNIKEEYPLGYKYPNENYPVMYIAKKKRDSIILYEVKWHSYTE